MLIFYFVWIAPNNFINPFGNNIISQIIFNDYMSKIKLMAADDMMTLDGIVI